ncbi:probable ATP-dependent RNA helicase CG8611 isoform X1 [Colias croceus]|uniref:probable ATP-dependent RNA helicase CG8611 isoform X1 n=1 Tax=Colias crocea TaxID=72248 RepID=UPI001E28165C|nr:probable ATP-dependent RNA helicase CG8611 isoform X1 [Colias croceus]
MEDLQLNITTTKKKNNVKGRPIQKNVGEYKFVSKPNYSGKIMARKRPQNAIPKKFTNQYMDNSASKFEKPTESPVKKGNNLETNLRDLAENKGKFQGKNYQEVTDEMVIKQKQRSGGWISSLFKNNPDVPRIGQRAVKPVVEKVFAGTTFADLNIHPHSIANLKQNLNLSELMTVQQKAIPIILQGRDVLIRSQTGSGKTLAYALPVIEGLQAIRPKINRHDGVRAVVVVPTRELAVQTYELFVKLTKPFIWIVPGLLSGGQKRKAEKARLRKGLNILVGTPGRINDHLRHTHSLNFAKTGCLILDEADRLLDMGYEKDVAAIVKAIEDHKKNATYDPMALVKQSIIKGPPEKDESLNDDTNKEETVSKHPLTDIFISKERQTILLSATLTKAVENLAGITMKEPVFVDTSDGKALVADSLKPSNEQKDTKINEQITNDKKNKPAPAIIEESKENNNESATKKEDTTVKSRGGLKAFNGANHPDIFKKDEVKGESNENQSKMSNDKDDDSDSDSDYEYFKVQKEINTKNNVEEAKEEEDEKEEIAEPQISMFENALKTAIVEDELVLPATVNQTFLVVPMKLRLVSLCSLIVEHCILNKKGGKMIVFMATLEMVDYFSELIETVLTGKDVKKRKQKKLKNDIKAKKRKTEGDDEDEKESSDDSGSEFEIDYEAPSEGGLMQMDVDVFSLHGSMPHEQRMEVFKQFRTARRGVLFCTDVAARGIDVPRVDLVLQYCAPASATDYVHRVGRTGRAAQVGAAVMFLLPSETEFVRHLEQKRIRLRQSDESKVLEALRTVAPSAASIQRAAIAVQAKLEHTAHSSKDWLARASRAFTSWVRFYSGYPREVRPYLDARHLHLGHAAKAFALRETPAALAKRARSDPKLMREKPMNRLTVKDEEQKKRPGFPKMKPGAFANRIANKQSSMHTASEFDSGLPPVDTYTKKRKNK